MAYSIVNTLKLSEDNESSEVYDNDIIEDDDDFNTIMRVRFMNRNNEWRWDGGIEEAGESIVLVNVDGWKFDDAESDDELIVLINNN